MRQIPQQYQSLVISAVADFDILDGDLLLFAGWVAQESSWSPYAIRYEPGFYDKYVKGMNLPQTERIARATSWGLLQIMGQVAREYGFQEKYLSALVDPAVNLRLAARILKHRYAHTRSWRGALAAYNGGLGGNQTPPYRNDFYVEKVLARARQYGYEGGL